LHKYLCCAHDSYHPNKHCPHQLDRQPKSRAASAGVSLSDYLLSKICQVAEQPTIDEQRARLDPRPATNPSVSLAEAVCEERNRK